MYRFIKNTVIVCAVATAISACAHRTVVVVREEPQPVAKNRGQVVAADNHFDHGFRFYNRGQYKQAIKQFDLCVAKNPRRWDAFYYQGLCYRELGNYRDAQVRFRYAERDCPDDINARARLYVGIAVAWERQGDIAQARSSYNMALKYDRANSDAKSGLARLEVSNSTPSRGNAKAKGKGVKG